MNEFFRAGVMLKDADQPEPGWPSRIQIPVVEKLSERLGYALLPFQMELSENQPEGFARHWTIQTTIPPEKHRAYAVQWFGLALTLTLLFLWILLKKNRE
jgi:surfeit locus 1 family protein